MLNYFFKDLWFICVNFLKQKEIVIFLWVCVWVWFVNDDLFVLIFKNKKKLLSFCEYVFECDSWMMIYLCYFCIIKNIFWLCLKKYEKASCDLFVQVFYNKKKLFDQIGDCVISVLSAYMFRRWFILVIFYNNTLIFIDLCLCEHIGVKDVVFDDLCVSK